jgi:hypothetical protein
MKNTLSIKTILATALLASAGAFSAFGLDTGIARADPDPNYGPHQWCPGVRKDQPPNGPGTELLWDWNVCHTFYNVGYGMGNVPNKEGSPSDVYEGPDPPPNDARHPCPPISWMCTRS